MKQIKRLLFAGFLCAGVLHAEDVYAIFNAKALQDANLSLDSGGIVDKILVDVDTQVKKGNILLTLANKDKASQLQAIKEQYLFAKAQYERYNKSADVVDRNTLDQYRSNYKKLEADYNYYQSAYDKSVLRAPFDGVIAERKIEVGDGVSGAGTVLLRLVSHKKKLVLQFDSKYQDKVRVGDLYEYSIDGGGVKKSTTITKIYPAVDANTRKMTAEAMVEDSMIPGLFGDGFIKTR